LTSDLLEDKMCPPRNDTIQGEVLIVMPNVIKVRVGNQDYDAIEQQFEIRRENWNEYQLLDGGVVRLKTTAQKIYRILDASGQPAFTAGGDPHALVRHSTQVVTSA